MADPLSVAGVILGVVSLGLQVADGLSKYLDGVGGRTEELNSTKQRGDENAPGPAFLVERHVKSCDTELSALYTLVSKLSQPDATIAGIQRLTSEHARKLTYPFNRSHIGRLEKRLDRVNSALQLALQVTTMHICVTSNNQIRQVHDIVLSMSSSQEIRIQNASLPAVRALPRVTGSMGHIGPLDSINIATSSTLDSQGHLLESIGWLQDCNALSVTREVLSRSCSCPHSLIRSCHERSWGHFLFSYANSSTRRHLRDCPFSETTNTQASQLTMKYKGRRTLLHIDFNLSLFSGQGTRRISISPSLSYYPVVNERTAPAFRILRIISRLALNHSMSRDATRDKDISRTMRYCFKSILTLYSKNRATPKDLDSSGRSLMHMVANVIYLSRPYLVTFAAGLFSSFMANLVACGVPVNTYDVGGASPSARLMDALPPMKLFDELIKCILPRDPDIPLFMFNNSSSHSSSLFWLLHDMKLAEVSACGPLSLAAVAGYKGVVKDLLQRDPQAITEVNQFGHTPLHLSINQPSCLRLILEASGPEMIDKVDFANCTPLDYASQFDYNESARILLASGGCITPYSIRFGRGSCVDLLFTMLKQRREELKVLALNNLTEAEATSFNLQENTVLDCNASRVRDFLVKRCIHVPSWMSELPMRLGFRDVDSCQPLTRTPLLMGPEIINTRWLIEHGADYWTPYKERRNWIDTPYAPITQAHFVLSEMGYSLLRFHQHHCAESDAENEAYRFTFEKLAQVQTSDDCVSCFCFTGGCTPYKAFFDGAGWRETNHSPQELAESWLKCSRTLQSKVSRAHSVAALRRITFDALKLSHTCCDLGSAPGCQASILTQEEVAEIHSEQDALLTLLSNHLIVLDQIALENRGDEPLIISDPEEFWLHRWLPQMEEALKSLDDDKITDEERSASKALGVVWGPPRPEVMKPGDWTSDYMVELEDWTPEIVMKEVAKIMDE
ncbi:hypothetical protein F5Y08DRAFT_350876 [Xylaria arbuscula]|nr:hypothetical protein F5Y08DRAFT_350876 [Xylaria arbuscula]